MARKAPFLHKVTICAISNTTTQRKQKRKLTKRSAPLIEWLREAEKYNGIFFLGI